MDQTSSNLVLLVIAGLGTALACGLGAVPLFFAGKLLQAWKAALRGLAAGFMAVAAIEGLIRPALNSGGLGQTAVGLGIGTVFVLAMRWAMHGRDVEVGGLRGAGVRQSALMFAVLFIHSVPEGMAMGAAQASGVQGLNVFVIAAIALQNIPEGTAIAIPMASSGFGKGAQFWGAVLTSIPQPIGAPLAYILVSKLPRYCRYHSPSLAGQCSRWLFSNSRRRRCLARPGGAVSLARFPALSPCTD
jgi:zinc transporter, ZIP family